MSSHDSAYQFAAKTIDGVDISLEKYKGKVLLVVNVASRCGFTDRNYKGLQKLFENYEEDGLAIAAFPCNQFLSQEPLSDEKIKKWVVGNYGVTFDLYSKVDVNGNHTHPLYRFLKAKQPGFGLCAIKWNFTKFLVDRNGVPVKRYAPTADPHTLANDIERLLAI